MACRGTHSWLLSPSFLHLTQPLLARTKKPTYSFLKAMETCIFTRSNGASLDIRNGQKCGSSTTGTQYCCNSGDTCLEDSICRYTPAQPGGSGYYIGGCTDSSFSEPCSKSCCKSYSIQTSKQGSGVMDGVLTLTIFSTADLPSREIVFMDLLKTNLWACCYQQGGDQLDCNSM